MSGSRAGEVLSTGVVAGKLKRMQRDAERSGELRLLCRSFGVAFRPPAQASRGKEKEEESSEELFGEESDEAPMRKVAKTNKCPDGEAMTEEKTTDDGEEQGVGLAKEEEEEEEEDGSEPGEEDCKFRQPKDGDDDYINPGSLERVKNLLQKLMGDPYGGGGDEENESEEDEEEPDNRLLRMAVELHNPQKVVDKDDY